VIHEFQVGVKVFAARLEAHQKINITIRVNRLITRKRGMSQASCQFNETGRFIRLHGHRLPPSAQLRSGAQSLTQALRLNALEEVPYALGLIRQSLEGQLEGEL